MTVNSGTALDETPLTGTVLAELVASENEVLSYSVSTHIQIPATP